MSEQDRLHVVFEGKQRAAILSPEHSLGPVVLDTNNGDLARGTDLLGELHDSRVSVSALPHQDAYSDQDDEDSHRGSAHLDESRIRSVYCSRPRAAGGARRGGVMEMAAHLSAS